MSLYTNEKATNFRLFSPRADNSYRKLDLAQKTIKEILMNFRSFPILDIQIL